MKKIIFIASCALFALVGCSKEDDINFDYENYDYTNAIVINDNSIRATDIDVDINSYGSVDITDDIEINFKDSYLDVYVEGSRLMSQIDSDSDTRDIREFSINAMIPVSKIGSLIDLTSDDICALDCGYYDYTVTGSIYGKMWSGKGTGFEWLYGRDSSDYVCEYGDSADNMKSTSIKKGYLQITPSEIEGNKFMQFNLDVIDEDGNKISVNYKGTYK